MVAEKKFTLLEKRGRVAKIIFNRPEKKNALSRGALTEIASVLDELRADDQISVVSLPAPAMKLTARAGI